MNVTIKDNEKTRNLGIAGLTGTIERTQHGGSLYAVLVWDEGGPAGPYKLRTEDIQFPPPPAGQAEVG